MVITKEWQEAVESIAQSQRSPLIVMVVGAVDTGKTTFCTFLARTLFERGHRVAVVDADLGQSDIGLPTTIGMGFVNQPIAHLREVPCQAAYFVGAISPVGHLLPVVAGTKLMVERALALGATAVVVDTDGLVHGGAGIALKHHTFELLRPTHVVLLQRHRELAIFQRQWEGVIWTTVMNVPVPNAVTEKTREQRRQFREQRFREWLSQCREFVLPYPTLRFRNTLLGQGIAVPPEALDRLSELMGVSVLHAERIGDVALVIVEAPPLLTDFAPVRQFFGGAPYIRWATPSRYEQLIVGALDANEELLTVGITFHLDFRARTLSILAPPFNPERVRTLVFGTLRLALDGTELEAISPGNF